MTAGRPLVLPLPRGTFHALTWGDPAAPPLLWLHGFPDHPPTAESFLSELARTGRHVIAPWLRGYAPSPTGGAFDLDSLAADIVAILDELRIDRVDLVGHDWGAAITYRVSAIEPGRVRRAVALAIPHPLTFVREVARPAQLRRSAYMLWFQLPGVERLVRARDFAWIDRLWRKWSPGFVLENEQRAALHACLAASLPGPLGYYRAMVRPLAGLKERMAAEWPRIEVPVLQLHGSNDGCVLPPRNADGDRARFAEPRFAERRFAERRFAERRFAERCLEVVPNTGHFLHLEEPAAIAARVAAWLA